jgi:hypothetical protein
MRALTGPQLEAIDLLAAGKTDREAAAGLHLPRTCVTRWRLYDPLFQAELNRQRAELWSAAIDRLRSLVPKALDALAAELEDRESSGRLKAASAVLRLAQLPSGSVGIGPSDPGELVRQVVTERRKGARGVLADLLERDKGLPPFEQHLADTWRELEALASEPQEPIQE